MNAREIEEIPDDVRRNLRFHAVRTMDEVVRLAFRQPPRGTGVAATESVAAISAPAPAPPMAH